MSNLDGTMECVKKRFFVNCVASEKRNDSRLSSMTRRNRLHVHDSMQVSFSFDSEKHFPLHPVLNFASSQHHMDDLHDSAFVVFLLHKVLNDSVLGNLE